MRTAGNSWTRIRIAAFLLAMTLTITAGPQLTLSVSPRWSSAPAIITVSVRIEPHQANRTIEIIADSEGFYRSSQIPLDGDRAPRVLSIQWRGLPAGDYVISGILADEAGRERASVRQQLAVDAGPEF